MNDQTNFLEITCSMKLFIIYVDMNILLENTPLIKLNDTKLHPMTRVVYFLFLN